jgi:hypothetical protein
METKEKLIALIGVGVAGYLGYRYVYLPAKMRRLIAAQAAAAGMSPDAYMAKIGAVACQGIGAYYGVPPSASGGVCNVVGGYVQSAPSWLSSIGHSAATSTLEAGQAFGGGVAAIGSGTGSAIASVTGGIGSAARTVTAVSVEGARAVGNVLKDGIEGASMLPINIAKSTVAGVGSVAKGLGRTIASIF